MNRRKAARLLAVLAFLLTVVDIFHGYFVWETLEETVARLLAVNGFDAIIEPPSWMYYVYYFIQLATLGGIIANIDFARHVLAINVVVFLIGSLLFGIGVSLPFQIFISLLISYMYGAILTLLYGPWGRD